MMCGTVQSIELQIMRLQTYNCASVTKMWELWQVSYFQISVSSSLKLGYCHFPPPSVFQGPIEEQSHYGAWIAVNQNIGRPFDSVTFENGKPVKSCLEESTHSLCPLTHCHVIGYQHLRSSGEICFLSDSLRYGWDYKKPLVCHPVMSPFCFGVVLLSVWDKGPGRWHFCLPFLSLSTE
jgi:hypothetical protein